MMPPYYSLSHPASGSWKMMGTESTLPHCWFRFLVHQNLALKKNQCDYDFTLCVRAGWGGLPSKFDISAMFFYFCFQHGQKVGYGQVSGNVNNMNIFTENVLSFQKRFDWFWLGLGCILDIQANINFPLKCKNA